MTLRLLFIFLLLWRILPAQVDDVVEIKEIPLEGILLDHGWKYKVGDDLDYAKPDFDHRTWQSIDPVQDIDDIPPLWKDSVVWFRIQLGIDTKWVGNLAFTLMQSGASEIFLNGQLIHSFGVLSTTSQGIVAVNPMAKPFSFPVQKPGVNLLAVRYRLEPGISYTTKWNNPNWGIFLKINSFENANIFYKNTQIYIEKDTAFRTSAYTLLAILFLAFYVSDRKRRTSLYFFMYAAIWAIVWSMFNSGSGETRVVRSYYYLASFSLILQVIGWIFLLNATYELLGQKKLWGYNLVVLFGICCVPIGIYIHPWGWYVFAMGFATIINIDITRIALIGFRNKKRGASILVVGASVCLGFWILFLVLYYIPMPPHLNQWLVFSLSHLSLPIAVSIFIGYDFAKTNQTLEQKLEEVKKLSEEKNQILSFQKELLETEVEERTHELQVSLDNLRSTQAQLIQSEKMASLGELTAGIAHEIQNPLNFVNNFSEVSNELIDEMKAELAVGNLQPATEIADDVKQNLQKILHHGKRADAIIKGMLQHSRSSSGQKELTDINALCDEYLRLAYHGLRAKDKSFNAKFETDFDSLLPQINVVPQDIGRVILNLINNAFYAVNEKVKRETANVSGGSSHDSPFTSHYEPLVKLSTKILGDRILISVADNGPGIPDSIKEKIFQPFFTTKPTGQGTGLGLSLSYDIVKAHGGELKVETEVGNGTNFIINLPV